MIQSIHENQSVKPHVIGVVLEGFLTVGLAGQGTFVELIIVKHCDLPFAKTLLIVYDSTLVHY